MSVEVIDPASAAGIASAALDQALVTLRSVLVAAQQAATSAATAQASQTAISALFAAAGVNHRWTGTVLQIMLPDGTYGASVDLRGVQGVPGPAPNLLVGTVTNSSTPAVAINSADPLNPIIDFVFAQGPAGNAGWTPVIAFVADGSRVVAEIADWTGGAGTKPSTGQYVGAAGFVSTISAAIDMRGPAYAGTITGFGESLVAAASAAAVKSLLGIAIGDVSGAQAALGFTPENVAHKGVASGYAGLDGSGKVPSANLPASLVGALVYQGTWNASTNSPHLASGTGTQGNYYKVATAGSTTLDGLNQWNVGDSVVFDGTTWDKIDGISNEMISVAGLTGVVAAAALKSALTIAASDVSGLGNASTKSVGTTAGTVAAGDDSRFAAALKITNDLYEIALAGPTAQANARTNIGLPSVPQALALSYGDPLNFF